jgi:hypothetical protein
VPPLALNLITNTLLKHYTNNTDNSINVINHPLPQNFSQTLLEISQRDLRSFLLGNLTNWTFFVCIIFSWILFFF